MSDHFYRAFEERYRGSRETIKTRLRAYRPFLDSLAALYPGDGALDLGCGRGEWLELLGEAGFAARGVDLDEGMLAACRERGLQAECADALKTLQESPAASLALVSAFHVVEHVPFDVLRAIVREALRVLRPGGLLILETPNPENLVVGAADFYLDPSHERPLPPNLLGFVTEHTGFLRNKIVRLQEPEGLREAREIRLLNVLSGVSPDYSVVAQKPAAPEVLARFDAAFDTDYGLVLDTLAQRYDAQGERRLADIHRRIAEHAEQAARSHAQAVERAAQAEHRAGLLEARLMQAEDRLGQAAQAIGQAKHRLGQAEQLIGQAEHRLGVAEHLIGVAEHRLGQAEQRLAEAEARAARYAEQLLAVLHSRSWRITAPMRLAGGYARRFRAAAREGRLGSGIKRRLKALLRATGLAVQRHPGLSRAALTVLDRFPTVKYRLRALLQTPVNIEPAPVAKADGAPVLSPRAAHFHARLKKAVGARKH
ncbi:MAG TPA: class I SAM-dependent methyltransferase [Paucimonas sp.]|nr:class I SAM-dependent methyltransferase [Paucimonas sp.]